MKKIYIKKICAIITILVITALSIICFTACTEEEAEATTYLMEEDTVFAIDLQNSTIMGLPFNLFIDDDSNITINKNGTATVTFLTTRALRSIFNIALSQGLTDTLNLSPFIEMAFEYIPGFSLENMTNTINSLTAWLGLSLMGFDWTDPEVEEMFIAIGETGTLPEGLKLPAQLTLQYSANYYIQEVVSPYTGTYTGVYLGKHQENGEPFVFFDMRENEQGTKLINWKWEVLKLDVNAIEIIE